MKGSITYLFFLFCVIGLLLLFYSFSIVIIFSISFLLLKSIVGKEHSYILFSFIAGNLFVILFYFYWIEFYGSPYFLGIMSDDYAYDIYWSEGFIERYGINIFKISDFLNEIQSGLGTWHNSKGYVAFVIFLRYISSIFDGYHTIIPRIVNILFLSLTGYYCSKISFFYTHNEEIKKTVFFAVFFNPLLLFISVHVFRDTIVVFILVYIFYLLLKNKSIYIYTKILVLLVILYFFRTSILLTSIFVIAIMSLKSSSYLKTSTIFIILFSIIFLCFFSNYTETFFEQVDKYQQLNTVRMGTIGGKIFNLPLPIGILPRIIFMIFTPVPSLNSFYQLFISISTILQIIFFPFLFWGILKRMIDRKLLLVFLIYFLGVAFSSATFRHVMMYLPFGIIATIIVYKKSEIRFLSNNYLIAMVYLLLAFSGSIMIAVTF